MAAYACFLLFMALHLAQNMADWISHGGDLWNRRFAYGENKIDVDTVPGLSQKWKFNTGADVSATPAIYQGVVFVPSWNGLVFAVTFQGAPLWSVNLTEVTGFSGTLSRTTPSVTQHLVLVGLLGPARVVALERLTGRLRWISPELDQTPLSRITMSGTAFQEAFYVGISSLQELRDEVCCTFQGSFQKLDISTGRILWKTLMMPDNHGEKGQYSGVAVWGSSPSIDDRRRLVYIATGNLYTVPPDVQNCINKNLTNCIPPTVCDDAVIALDMDNGTIRWCNRLGTNDIWRLACVQPNLPVNCPTKAGPDFDFGEAPMLVNIPSETNFTRPREIVVTGQKSGFIWAHDRTTGELVWRTVAGPGGSGGGATWGSATDGERVYTNIVNNGQLPFTLAPSKNVTTGGGWVAMNAATGEIMWSTANPTHARAHGPVTVANGVVFVSSFDPEGHVLALNAGDGVVLWNSTTNATVYGGFSVGDGCAFVGTGYAQAPLGPLFNGTLGNGFFAFCV